MSDPEVEQALKLASGNTSSLMPQERTLEEERLHRKQQLAKRADRADRTLPA